MYVHIKSAYKKLVNQGYGVSAVFAYLCNLKVMSSVQSYVWRTLTDRITTKQNLHKRGVMVGDTLCVFCGKEEESTSHNLVSCKVSIEVWNMCFSWLGINSVSHNELINHFE